MLFLSGFELYSRWVPLHPSVPKTKESSARLRVPSSQLPRVNTQRFKNSSFEGYFSNME